MRQPRPRPAYRIAFQNNFWVAYLTGEAEPFAWFGGSIDWLPDRTIESRGTSFDYAVFYLKSTFG